MSHPLSKSEALAKIEELKKYVETVDTDDRYKVPSLPSEPKTDGSWTHVQGGGVCTSSSCPVGTQSIPASVGNLLPEILKVATLLTVTPKLRQKDIDGDTYVSISMDEDDGEFSLNEDRTANYDEPEFDAGFAFHPNQTDVAMEFTDLIEHLAALRPD